MADDPNFQPREAATSFPVNFGRVLTFYCITDHPTDFPDHFVVRRHILHPGAAAAIPEDEKPLPPSLAAARATIPAGAINVGRDHADDPVISETWML